ncbi:LytR/AlgR family response regulator transcription factor [Ruminococcus sp.]|uniref:LytR/AlgR family response regulator transcription factor n=2 Tax=Ruminococcus sp. TaxID=41978 RepID=UPI003AB2567A
MNVLICDDDLKIVQQIKNFLLKLSKQSTYNFDITCFSNGDSILDKQIKTDFAFIDIEMPLVNGLTLSAQLKRVNSNIIIFIITSHDTYLDDAMDLDVFRYLSKPIDNNRFFRALNTAINYYHSNTQIITLEYYDEYYSVFTSDIVYITIEERKAVIITRTRQKKYYTNKKLSYWKEKLKDYDYFAQPHYSYLVNLRYVSDFNKTQLNIKVDLKTETLPISQRNYSNFKKAYFAYIGV